MSRICCACGDSIDETKPYYSTNGGRPFHEECWDPSENIEERLNALEERIAASVQRIESLEKSK